MTTRRDNGGRGRKGQQLRAYVLRAYGPVLTCWLCGSAIGAGQPWDVDHVVPRSRGGGDEERNLRPAHASCNRSRGADEANVWHL